MVGKLADVQMQHQVNQWEWYISLCSDLDNQQLSLSLQLVFLKDEGLVGDNNHPSHVKLSELDLWHLASLFANFQSDKMLFSLTLKMDWWH